MMKKCPLDHSGHPDHREGSAQYNDCEEAQRLKMRKADDEKRGRPIKEATIHGLRAALAVVVVDDPVYRRDSMAKWVAQESVVDKLAREANRSAQRTSGPDFER